MTTTTTAQKTTPPQNRERKAKLIARAAWRRGLTYEDLAAMPYSGQEQSRTRFARLAYRDSADPADHDVNPPHGPESRTWRLVADKLEQMTERAHKGEPTPERDLMHERQAWAEEDPWSTPNTQQDPTAGSSSASLPSPRGHSGSPAPLAPDAGTPTTAPTDGTAAKPPSPPTTSSAPKVSATAGSSPNSATALPRGWAELAALPLLDYGSCINHPGRRPVVISPDGGRCPDCPPRPGEIHVKFAPTREQLAQDLAPFEGYRDGWGMTLNWAPKTHIPAPLRCYCGRCPLEGQ